MAGGPILIGFAPPPGEDALPAPVGIEGRLLESNRHGPTVIVLEDLPRADSATDAAVEIFAKVLENRPLWILGTSRPPSSLALAGRAQLEKFESATGSVEIQDQAIS